MPINVRAQLPVCVDSQCIDNVKTINTQSVNLYLSGGLSGDNFRSSSICGLNAQHITKVEMKRTVQPTWSTYKIAN